MFALLVGWLGGHVTAYLYERRKLREDDESLCGHETEKGA
jgi:hypothetical protein